MAAYYLKPLWAPNQTPVRLSSQSDTIEIGRSFFEQSFVGSPDPNASFLALSQHQASLKFSHDAPNTVQSDKKDFNRLEITNLGRNFMTVLSDSSPEKPTILLQGESTTLLPNCIISWSGKDYRTQLLRIDDPAQVLTGNGISNAPALLNNDNINSANLNSVEPQHLLAEPSKSDSVLPDINKDSSHHVADSMEVDVVSVSPIIDHLSDVKSSIVQSAINSTSTSAAPSASMSTNSSTNVNLSSSIVETPHNPLSLAQSLKLDITTEDTSLNQLNDDPSVPVISANPKNQVISTPSSSSKDTSLKLKMPTELNQLVGTALISVDNPNMPALPLHAHFPPAGPLMVPNSTVTPDILNSIPGYLALHAKQKHEVETLIAKQNLELANLVSLHRLELEGLLRQTPNLSLMSQERTTHSIRSSSTSSEEIDVMTVDDTSRSSTKVKSNGRKSKAKQANPPDPLLMPAPAPVSEDESMRRGQRKRKAAVQPDYFIDDKVIDQILGESKPSKRRKTVESVVEAPVAAAPVSFKKPKPRDNVSLQTILDIYSPLRNANAEIASFAHTKASKTLILYHTDCLDHITPEWHLESPARLTAAIDGIKAVIERYTNYGTVKTEFPPCELDLVRKCHEESYIRKIMAKIPSSKAAPPLHATQDIEMSLSLSSAHLSPPAEATESPSFETPKDTFVSFGSWNAALLAAGSVCTAIDEVMQTFTSPTGFKNAFCAGRPPGHHSGANGHDGANTNGYCLLNSVAIGAQYAFQKWNLKRIVILDFDVHMGNGTAQIVSSDPRILFLSLHGSQIYPFDEHTEAEAHKCAERIINVGYKNGTTGKEWMQLFGSLCEQKIRDFDPELILLSSGFDAHIDDPTQAGLLKVSDYVAITRAVKKLADTPSCQGRIVSVLEGGYDLRALKLCVAGHILSLME